jgi:hypothetical protein
MKTILFLIKLIHTIVWTLFVFIIFYILYAGIANEINIYVYIAIASIIIEGLVLMINQGKCPLTNVARKYIDDDSKDNFDIFLPNWLAKHNKIIFTSIFLVGTFLVLYRSIAQ